MDSHSPAATDGRRRVVIEAVKPSVDCGRFPLKRIVGQSLTIEADVFADGHDVVRAQLLTRAPGASDWQSVAMTELGNDAWRAPLELPTVGRYEYRIRGWVDAFASWHRDLKRRIEAEQDIGVDLQIGGELAAAAAERATGRDAESLEHWHTALASGNAGRGEYLAGADELEALMARYPDLSRATESDSFAVVVDPPKAGFSAWYELFPRSCSSDEGRHGTLRDCIEWLPRIADMGFDVVYLPPIHPIGRQFRKGRNNAVTAEPGEVGSPWAIGASEGGHREILSDLGTLNDFHALIKAATELGIDIALDIAFQCSPDHPYAKDHPEWFRRRPDGTIQYAENPPKKYQDIYPFDFESHDWRAMWEELTDVVLYWCAQGVRIFRVDNPHTKAFAFWGHLIDRVKAEYPETLFLSEAFTRPKVMYRLAKLGFSQSYTYFTWRNTKKEFIEYLTEIAQAPVADFFRPNFWPNTPDILPEHLQTGGRSTFVGRLVLAATLSSNYGIYGPAYETLEHLPLKPGSEEYWDSEKYQIRHWNFDTPESLAPVIKTINRARRENPALQSTSNLQFHPTDNDNLLCYSKSSPDGTNRIVVIVNLDFHGEQHGFVTLPPELLGVAPEASYPMKDLLTGDTFTWQGTRNFVELDPQKSVVAHILRIGG